MIMGNYWHGNNVDDDEYTCIKRRGLVRLHHIVLFTRHMIQNCIQRQKVRNFRKRELDHYLISSSFSGKLQKAIRSCSCSGIGG